MTFINSVKALTFDVFGTVVDWRSSIIRDGEAFGQAHGLQLDWSAFADAWRAGYQPAMHRVRTGKLPWTKIDDLHRMILDTLLTKFEITELIEAEVVYLNQVWHRLAPWPDSVTGLTRLKEQFILATLSNGNMSLLINMARHSGLPWDCVLSAELAGHYKPDPEVYQRAADLLGLHPAEIMMVAAHNSDLKAAKAVGYKTAFVLRSTEYGPHQTSNLEADPTVDIIAKDFNDLAAQLVKK